MVALPLAGRPANHAFMTAFSGDIEHIVGRSIRGGFDGRDAVRSAFLVCASVLTRLDALIVGVAARSGRVANVRRFRGDHWLSAGCVDGVGEQP